MKIQNNNLTSLDISNDPGLLYLNASRNSLNQTAVDGILQTLDSYNTNGGSLDLTGNAAPSITGIGIAHANNLTTRNWEVKISSRNNPLAANLEQNSSSILADSEKGSTEAPGFEVIFGILSLLAILIQRRM